MREPKRDRAALSRALRRYREAPLPARAAVRARAFLSDLTFIEPYVPRRVLGVDLDERKLAVAKQTERDGLRFEVGEIVTTSPPPCDAITLVDVLYLLPEDAQEQLIEHCGRTLPEGRTLLVFAQEARTDPRYVLGYAQELVSTSLGLTRGGGQLWYRSRDEMVALLGRHGFVTDVVPLPRRPYTDTLYVARRVPK
jgi:hypothetical protein